MSALTSLNLGIVGACGRGGSFKAACDAIGRVRVHAVCDIDANGLGAAAERLGASERYERYEDMLSSSELDAVIVGTPMHLHVPHSLAALEHGLHVLCEVPAGVSVEECRTLTETCVRGDAIYMMAENCNYTRTNAIVGALVAAGLFGVPYYAEGEYLHELKRLNERTPWRRTWQTGVDGVTYGTHALGPILQWMQGDRVESVCCAGTGHHYRDPRGDAYGAQDTSVMLCRMRSGGLIKIRVDMLSDRPDAMSTYELQGTDGAYESPRAPGEAHRVWLRDRSSETAWSDLEDLAIEFLPDYWQRGREQAAGAGHDGADFFEVLDFFDAIEGGRPCPIGIHEAMDMTLPGLLSQASIRDGGSWKQVPDSRDWCKP